MEEKKFNLDEFRKKHKKKPEKDSIESRVVSMGKLKLIHYRAVLIPDKGLVAQNNFPILWHKSVVIKDKVQKIYAYEAVAKEQLGRVLRGDKALQYLIGKRQKATGEYPKEPPKAYVLGSIIKRRF